ncbi:VP1 protein [Corriparta virus]|uniref:RNA-directed RNA polymerase n=6 Tax=Corriparta virus TaxID=40053 RepID=T1SRC3_9REOV|nr:VP1 protein [Corriparta virus]AGT51054.1 VP1 protein [Corriparta virus]
MATVEHRLQRTRKLIQKLVPNFTFDRKGYGIYYRYSPRNVYNKDAEKNVTLPEHGATTLYGIPVLSEITWKTILSEIPESADTYEIMRRSIIPLNDLDPEEEFLRHYALDKSHVNFEFVMKRSREECAVYGDMALRHWALLLADLSDDIQHVPLGLKLMRSIINHSEEPFRQNTRDLALVRDEDLTVTIMLIFEMCISESILEYNAILRMKEEGFECVCIGSHKICLIDLVRELFLICLPHPKKINNMLRATFSWYVKTLGTASEYVNVLRSNGGDDRNSKDVVYHDFIRVKNPFFQTLRHSNFHKSALKKNIEKAEEAIKYSNSITGLDQGMPVFMSLLRTVYEDEFDPTKSSHMVFTSYLLSLQVMSGYGRAWVKNVGDDENKIKLPTSSNFIKRVSEKTEANFIAAYKEAEEHGFTIVKPIDMYSSLLRLAKNTSSGMSTRVEVLKSYTPSMRPETIELSSRQKALVIMGEGDKIYSKEFLEKKFNSVDSFQTKGSRDVPIKATRTIYAIHISILAPQLILTLPLNEYFAQTGGPTTPDAKKLGGKIIVGDLEATGSRVMDAADTFRNTADPNYITLALDYSEYDSHMSWYNFRSGMLDGMRKALRKYESLRYQGLTIEELIDYGYGEGRVRDTLWSGKRAVRVVDRAWYESLPDSDRIVPEDAPFRTFYPGVNPIRSLSIIKPHNIQIPILVSPWDGSDLAKVSTHLSGENSTLAANSLHNKGIGSVIIEEIARRLPGKSEIRSEMYVGDDTLFYLTMNCYRSETMDKMLEIIFDVVDKCGHEASPAKTTCLPFSAEKTQTHAKQGVYIPQDRMMIVSSERRKDIENIGGYMRSNIMTFCTKVSRGFSEYLAYRILEFKASILGYRKLKRTVFDGVYRSRIFSSKEDGYTLCIIRDPACLYTPVAWRGFGCSPVALNVVNTPELFVDCLQMHCTQAIYKLLLPYINHFPPLWNETSADKHQIKTRTPMGLFSKLTRPAVVASLSDPTMTEICKELPLQGFGPTQLSSTMMHNALLKEPRARALLSPGYELNYQRELNAEVEEYATLDPTGHDLEITTAYTKIFEIHFGDLIPITTHRFPDRNLSPTFRAQKEMLGNRTMNRSRMSYIDRIDAILRGDIVMRGFITANHILNVMEEVGAGQSVDDLATLFQLMNIEQKIARRLAEQLGKDRSRFDTQRLSKGGVGGDEFTMSLNVLTEEFFEKYVTVPGGLFQAEKDAVCLHASQILMTRSACGLQPCKLVFRLNDEHKKGIRKVRVVSKLPRIRVMKAFYHDVRSLSAAIVEQQHV